MRGARKVAEALATPLVPSDYLDLIDPLRSGADLRGRIVEVRPETADAVTVVIRPGRGWLGHVPGQYIRIGIDIDGVRNWRAYSLTHRADGTAAAGIPAGCVAITTKAIPDGKVSNAPGPRGPPRHPGHARPGHRRLHPPERRHRRGCSSSPPAAASRRSWGCCATTSASSPTSRRCTARPRHPTSSSPASSQSYAADGRLALTVNLDDEHGVLDLARLDALVPDWRERETWTCGPTGLLDAAEAHWAGAGVADRLHTERFRPTVVEPGEGGQITFLTTDLTVEADGGTPILDAGEEAGVLMPSGCRMGICFGCVVTMRQGAVRDLRTGDVTVVEPGDELPVQTCINAVAGSCDIEL